MSKKYVSARSIYEKTLFIEPNEAIVWDWRLENHDISFSLEFHPSSSPNSASPKQPLTIVPLTRYTDCVTSSVKGVYFHPGLSNGNLLFRWDNKHSSFRGKNLTYNLKKVNRDNLIYPYGTVVQSIFGPATILSYNKNTGLYQVALPYGKASLNVSSLPPYIPSGTPESRESIESRVKVGVWLFFTNHLQLSEEFFLHEQDEHPAFASAYACLSYLRAFMTWEKADMDEANRRLEDTRRRVQPALPKEGILASVTRIVTWSKNNTLTSTEMEAVLMTAETHMLQSQLLLVEENVYSFIQAGLKIRAALALYQRCFSQYEQMNNTSKTNAAGEYQVHNHTSVQLGMGGYYLVLSLMFPSILRLLSFLGFTGRGQEAGLTLLTQCQQARAVRSPLAALILLFFHVIVPSFYTLYIEEHIIESETIFSEMFSLYPNSSMFLWIEGRHMRNKRLLVESVQSFTRSAHAQPGWQQLQHLIAYEKGQSFFCLLQFRAAIPCFQLLKKENQWSKAFYIYMEAIALLEDTNEEKRVATQIIKSPSSIQTSIDSSPTQPLSPSSSDLNTARSLLSTMEEVCQRKFGGKNLTMELYILQRSKEWLNGKGLILPTLEMIYIFNGFTLMNTELLIECRNRVMVSLARSPHNIPAHISITAQHKQLSQITPHQELNKPVSASQHYMLLLLYASLSHYISKLSFNRQSPATFPLSPSSFASSFSSSIASQTLVYLSEHESECEDRFLIAFARFERASVALQETVLHFNNILSKSNSGITNCIADNNNLKKLKKAEYKRLRSLFQFAESFPSPYHFKNRLHFRVHLARMELKKWKNRNLSNNGNYPTGEELKEEEEEEDAESSLVDAQASTEGERDLLSELTEEQKLELELEKPKEESKK